MSENRIIDLDSLSQGVRSPAAMSRLTIQLFLAWCCWSVPAFCAEAAITAPDEAGGNSRIWARLLDDAGRAQLPTKFLKALPPDFIHFEFDDLRTYAAEYHPDEHRMVLNRSLSFNSAGRTLKPLGKMTHKELEVLYHELFHAYMNYLQVVEEHSGEAGHGSGELLRFARKQQACRYGEVRITPVALRKDDTESRYLTKTESWEALNETWAVFIGWAVWNQLEVQHKTRKSMFREPRQAHQWLRRLKAAFEKGDLRGYYVPEDPDERRLAQKRYLAKPSQLTLKEAGVLMKQVLGFQHDFMKLLDASFEPSKVSAC
ncbi:MAG: hypothetical protein KF722_13900 [Nitrospira sp.]|nr:hypothetical protein [Nitrospira sp.]